MRFDITPENLGQFISSLLEQLGNHLMDVDDTKDKRTIVNEARQYLRGAHAICVSTSIGEWPQQGNYSSADGMAGLLNHLFEEAHAQMDEIADETLYGFGRDSRTAEELHKQTGH